MSDSWILERHLLWPLLAGIAVAGTGCIIGGDKCDAHQVELRGNYSVCVCEPNAVMNPSGYGCTPCGEHEEALEDACVCKAGYAKAAEGESCTKTDIGASCSPELACADPYPYCFEREGAEGYCTAEDCAKNDDCPAQWTCEESEGTHFCQKPRTGLGAHCDTSADCAAFDAQYCDAFKTHTCQLEGCAAGGPVCPNAWGCCDYSALLGAPLSVCVAPSELASDGTCPMGGQLVAP